MSSLIAKYKNASAETKSFILVTFIFSFVILATTIYCYARLDYVRSYKTAPENTLIEH